MLICPQSPTATPPHLRSEAVWAQYSTISNTVTTLRHSLPPVSDPRGTEPLETIGRANPDMVHAHIEIQAATILLANAVLDLPDFGGSQAALEAAFTVAGLMKQAGGEGGILPAIQAPVSLLVRPTFSHVAFPDSVQLSIDYLMASLCTSSPACLSPPRS